MGHQKSSDGNGGGGVGRPPISPSLAHCLPGCVLGEGMQARSLLCKKPCTKAAEASGCSQDTTEQIHTQAVQFTEALGALYTYPSRVPASGVSLQCWPGTGVIHVLKSTPTPRAPGTKALVGHCFYH